MNAKLCKRLRKQAHRMMLELHLDSGGKTPVRDRFLIVFGPHEKRMQELGAGRVTAVNHPQTTRGIYRWLKRNYAKAIA